MAEITEQAEYQTPVATPAGGPVPSATGAFAGTLRPRLVAQLRRDVEHALKSRVFRDGTLLARVEDATKSTTATLWRGLHQHSGLAVSASAALAWLAADLVGVGEVTLILGVGYAAYEVFRKGLPVEEALSKARMG